MEKSISKAPTERLFVAVRLPSELREKLGETCRRMSEFLPFAKWVHPEDYHLTLQFLGDTESARIPELTAALSAVADSNEPFKLTMDKWGTFGVPDSPRVLWAALAGELGRLAALQAAVTAATLPLGFHKEERAYHPHITLARKYRGKMPFSAAGAELESGDFTRIEKGLNAPWEVEGFVIFATRMHAQPMYVIVENLSFSKK